MLYTTSLDASSLGGKICPGDQNNVTRMRDKASHSGGKPTNRHVDQCLQRARHKAPLNFAHALSITLTQQLPRTADKSTMTGSWAEFTSYTSSNYTVDKDSAVLQWALDASGQTSLEYVSAKGNDKVVPCLVHINAEEVAIFACPNGNNGPLLQRRGFLQ